MAFHANFWNESWSDHGGWEKVWEQVGAGRRGCKAMSDLFRARASIEEDYARALARLSKHHPVPILTKGLGEGWAQFVKATDQTAALHFDSGKSFSEQSAKLLTFAKQSKTSLKPMEQKLRKLQAEKKSGADKTMRAKDDYHRKCDTIESYDYQARLLQSDAAKSKEAAKVSKVVTKNQLACTTMKKNYELQLEGLEATRRLWEKETEDSLKKMEAVEEEREKFVRNALWAVSNAESALAVSLDKEMDAVRTVLSHLDIKADLAEFVKATATGDARPPPIVFEPHAMESRRPPSVKQSKGDPAGSSPKAPLSKTSSLDSGTGQTHSTSGHSNLEKTNSEASSVQSTPSKPPRTLAAEQPSPTSIPEEEIQAAPPVQNGLPPTPPNEPAEAVAPEPKAEPKAEPTPEREEETPRTGEAVEAMKVEAVVHEVKEGKAKEEQEGVVVSAMVVHIQEAEPETAASKATESPGKSEEGKATEVKTVKEKRGSSSATTDSGEWLTVGVEPVSVVPAPLSSPPPPLPVTAPPEDEDEIPPPSIPPPSNVENGVPSDQRPESPATQEQEIRL